MESVVQDISFGTIWDVPLLILIGRTESMTVQSKSWVKFDFHSSSKRCLVIRVEPANRLVADSRDREERCTIKLICIYIAVQSKNSVRFSAHCTSSHSIIRVESVLSSS